MIPRSTPEGALMASTRAPANEGGGEFKDFTPIFFLAKIPRTLDVTDVNAVVIHAMSPVALEIVNAPFLILWFVCCIIVFLATITVVAGRASTNRGAPLSS